MMKQTKTTKTTKTTKPKKTSHPTARRVSAMLAALALVLGMSGAARPQNSDFDGRVEEKYQKLIVFDGRVEDYDHETPIFEGLVGNDDQKALSNIKVGENTPKNADFDGRVGNENQKTINFDAQVGNDTQNTSILRGGVVENASQTETLGGQVGNDSSKNAVLSASVGENDQKTAVSDLGVEDGSLNFGCKSLILMEATTGAILYKQNADEALPPASVTKIMTLLLVMEALEAGRVRLDSTVTVSANAASMGGSQVFLKEGEQMPLEDLLKSVVIASANDAAVALAEYIAGSVESFVSKMNARAAELGMTNSHFENVTGLDDSVQSHLTSAKDIALMSQALIRHPKILEYSSIWMDSIRNGEFGLTNTNRLVRFYKGCTGLKTGSTAKAGFCVSVTAERDGLSLICVVMGAESRDVRNAIAAQALDWGFANYGVYNSPAPALSPITVQGGVQGSCALTYAPFACVLPKGELGQVTLRVELPERVSAPLKVGDTVGKLEFCVGERVIGACAITATQDVPRINFFQLLARVLARFALI